MTEFKHLALTLDCVDCLTISTPSHPSVSTTFIALKKDYAHVSVVLLVQVNNDMQGFTEQRLSRLIENSPFAMRVR